MRNNPGRIVLCCILASTFFAACFKEKSFEPSSAGSHTSAGDTTYQPFTKNSYWKYKNSGAFTGESILTSTGNKKTANGIEYYIFNSTSTATGSVETLFGIKAHNYYYLMQGVAPSGGTFDINFLYLNDTASVGYTWNYMAGQGNGFTARTAGTIVEKGMTMVVEGKTYKEVIHTEVDLQYELPIIGTTTFATYDYYVAKGIGIIKVDSEGDPILTNGIKTASDLYEYSIK